MAASVMILRGPAPSRSPLARMRDDAAKDRCMNVIGSLMANAAGHGERVNTGKRIVRYAAMALCHCLGLMATAAYLQSLAGQIQAEAESAGAQ